MKEIGAAKFKEQCLALLDNLDADGLIVTKRGKPVARVIPYETNDGDLIGSLRGKLKIKGDIFTTGLRLGRRMINLDTHILLCALDGELHASEQSLLARSRWSISSIVLWELDQACSARPNSVGF